MPRWKYLTVSVVTNTFTVAPPRVDQNSVVGAPDHNQALRTWKSRLDELGEQGWELVNVIYRERVDGSTGTAEYEGTFKKEKPLFG